MKNGRRFNSYKESMIGKEGMNDFGREGYVDEGKVSEDDAVDDGEDEAWFGMGMTREKKIEAPRPWGNSLIIKLIGRSIEYHYL